MQLPRLYLKTITVVTQGAPSGPFDDDGRQAGATNSSQSFEGALQPISARERAQMQAVGTVGPVPSFIAWLPIDAPVRTMDYHLEVDGLSYYPWQDAQDVGGAGSFFRVQLGSPGQRRG